MKTPYERVKKWRDKNKIKRKAQMLVFSGVRNRTIFKTVCFCGSNKVEAHHEDYYKPIDVVWLCKKHHIEADKIRRSKE